MDIRGLFLDNDFIDSDEYETEKNQRKVCNLLNMIGGNSKLNIATNERMIPSEYMDWVVDNYNNGVIPQETLQKSLGYFELSIEDISDDIHPIQMENKIIHLYRAGQK